MTTIRLPLPDRSFEDYTVKNGPLQVARGAAQSGNASRIAYSAVHVTADPLADNDPWIDTAIDWDKTIAFRNYIWDLGLGVAEAMDTAQRGMGIDWPTALELIRRSLDAAKDRPGALIASGAGTDQLAADAGVTVDDVIRAYEEQVEAIEALGGRIILMASRALVRAARGPDDYLRVYDRILSQTREPVIIHWLGEMFDPALEGYWGSRDHNAAMDTALAAISANAAKVDGIKISLLSKEKEIAMRRRLPAGVRMYTGDDFNYAELIAGDEHGYSDALARHLRCDRTGGGRGARSLVGRRRKDLSRYPGTDRPAQPPHLQTADAVLQDRRGLPRLPQRIAGPFRDGRRPAERALGRPPRRTLSLGRPRAGAARSGLGRAPHETGDGGRWGGLGRSSQ